MTSPKTPPHSLEAEASVLGALLMDKDAIITVAEFLEDDHFYDNKHKDIFNNFYISLMLKKITIY